MTHAPGPSYSTTARVEAPTSSSLAAVRAIATGRGGIDLEDIAAPQCFEVEARLQDALDIPVFHDDQPGTVSSSLPG